MIKAPIWKETVYQTTADELRYRVMVGYDPVWEGVAYRRPDDTRAMIYMNRIAAEFMNGSLAFSTGLTVNTGECVEFKLYVVNGGVMNLVETYQFLFDFEGDWDGGDKMLSNPIDGILDPRMLVPFTQYCASAKDITIGI